jgi:hypothetical protein
VHPANSAAELVARREAAIAGPETAAAAALVLLPENSVNRLGAGAGSMAAEPTAVH